MKFEDAIRGQQSGKYRIAEHKWPGMTIGDLIGAVLGIHTQDSAVEFYSGYVEWLKSQTDLERPAEDVAKMNIGWCFGEGMPESDRELWRFIGAMHPVFGAMKTNPTTAEAIQAGMDAAKA